MVGEGHCGNEYLICSNSQVSVLVDKLSQRNCTVKARSSDVVRQQVAHSQATRLNWNMKRWPYRDLYTCTHGH